MPKTTQKVDEFRWCPNCGSSAARVIDSRPLKVSTAEPIIRRRRACDDCEHRWSTYEITQRAYETICEAAREIFSVFPKMGRSGIILTKKSKVSIDTEINHQI